MTGSVDQGGHPITLYRRIYLYLYQIVKLFIFKLPCQVQINYTDIFSFKKYFEKNFKNIIKEQCCNQQTIQLY